ncbi:WW domain-binding protein 11-like [Tubulanus polymorphus]|uniref:WW domain-binding protein 11-like n=1 Tax=Tubulanus polymorphus TaxID=672921 RepID=UPI003DA28EA4
MGRRSINTTKSGKYMNPTDQARKEARKKELKKNKKQRMMVRQAVLKGKDPVKLLEEMEIIDKMEYDPTNPPKLNEKVLKDKRKKLKETFERVVRLYEREDPEYCMVLKKEESEYYKRRDKMITLYDQIKFTENVELSMIPMPDMPQETPTAQIPLPDKPQPTPMLPNVLPKGILKKSAFDLVPSTTQRHWGKPVGPPPGSPPDLTDSENEIEDASEVTYPATLLQSYYNLPPVPGLDSLVSDRGVDKLAKQRKIRFHDDLSKRTAIDEESLDDSEENLIRKWLVPKPVPTPLQLKMLKMAGQQLPKPAAGLQDDDEDDQHPAIDYEGDEKKTKDATLDEDIRTMFSEPKVAFELAPEKSVPIVERKHENILVQTASLGIPAVSSTPGALAASSTTQSGTHSGTHSGLPPGPPPGVPPVMYRPPLPRPGVGGPPRMLPPGPPPGRPPGIPSGGLPRGPIPRAPPGVLPQQIIRQPSTVISPSNASSHNMTPAPSQMNPNVLSAPPSIMKPLKSEEEKKNLATIEAKPQIKHQIGDVTKFMPTSLRVKRDTKAKTSKVPNKNEMYSVLSRPAPQTMSKTKDDVYDMFMREMEDFL